MDERRRQQRRRWRRGPAFASTAHKATAALFLLAMTITLALAAATTMSKTAARRFLRRDTRAAAFAVGPSLLRPSPANDGRGRRRRQISATSAPFSTGVPTMRARMQSQSPSHFVFADGVARFNGVGGCVLGERRQQLLGWDNGCFRGSSSGGGGSVLRSFTSSSTLSMAAEDEETGAETTSSGGGFYADPATHPTFASLHLQSPILLHRLESALNLSQPSAVQAASIDAIASGSDVCIGAETGSGKTLAYLLPLIDDVLTRKRDARAEVEANGTADSAPLDLGYDYARAVILVPNKELAHQVVRMATPLCGAEHSDVVIWGDERLTRGGDAGGSAPIRGTGSGAASGASHESDDHDPDAVVRIAVLPGNLKAPKDFKPFRDSIGLGGSHPPVDLLIATPAALGPLGQSPKNVDLFADVETLVLDEADMLLDGGYIRPLEDVLMGFRRADKLASSSSAPAPAAGDSSDSSASSSFFDVKKTQHVLVAATLPDAGLKSVDAFIAKRFPYAQRIAMEGMHNARHYGLLEQGGTTWIECNENRERMVTLIDMLKRKGGGDGEEEDAVALKDEKVMVFLNSVDDVDGATNGLRRADINAVPYHAKIPLGERSANLDRFRRYVARSERGETDTSSPTDGDDDDAVPVLVCTDLAARGLDVPGVTAVVQLQFAGNVVSHLHRMGRCGRAGNRNGRGVTFYGSAEKELVDVVREAEEQQERMRLEGDVDDRENDKGADAGKVKNAFSRRRGFTKKRKKERREAREAQQES